MEVIREKKPEEIVCNMDLLNILCDLNICPIHG